MKKNSGENPLAGSSPLPIAKIIKNKGKCKSTKRTTLFHFFSFLFACRQWKLGGKKVSRKGVQSIMFFCVCIKKHNSHW
jgi:hypothetical protein